MDQKGHILFFAMNCNGIMQTVAEKLWNQDNQDRNAHVK